MQRCYTHSILTLLLRHAATHAILLMYSRCAILTRRNSRARDSPPSHTGCSVGCSHIKINPATMVPFAATCVDNGEGTCEVHGYSCHTGGLADSPNCFTPCA